MRMEARSNRAAERKPRLQKEDWVAAARRRLTSSGVDAVRVELLARDLGVTKGSFYWHFKDRADLLDALLRDWEEITVRATAALAEPATPAQRTKHFLETVTASAADPDEAALERAVLAWAQHDTAVAKRVATVEKKRTANAEELLVGLGFPPADAAVWADIGYTTFVGMMSRSSREARFRRPPRTDSLMRLLEAAQLSVERSAARPVTD
jgi:AcrR family transcriptional regulator